MLVGLRAVGRGGDDDDDASTDSTAATAAPGDAATDAASEDAGSEDAGAATASLEEILADTCAPLPAAEASAAVGTDLQVGEHPDGDTTVCTLGTTDATGYVGVSFDEEGFEAGEFAEDTAGGEPISGVGDEAVYLQSGQLRVHIGDLAFSVSVRLSDAPLTREVATSVAQIVLANI